MDNNNDIPDNWWNPYEFDPFEAITQIARNQEDLYNRQTINNMLSRNQQEQLQVQQQQIQNLENTLQAQHEYIGEMVKITNLLIDELKKVQV
ncbi:hypothetical protein UFOVP180_30 [uncultured Caudovirales phage]|uniref:Uncharacterized protein n=1 Tax=uncultured Caudovirales phage TaxID=2100421 RepID=A0A6J7WFX4_9CAUD|nr:hypothetical protein UFOVP180_30 [uncultured Caudovirales phage]